MAAIYGQNFYGTTTYGAPVEVDFKIDPFVAIPEGYNTVRVTWKSPSGDWSRFRLIQSRVGFAADEDDGNVVIDTTQATSEYVDRNLVGGAWYYYTIFIQRDGTWYLAGSASALVVSDTGMAKMLWDKIPRYFHYQPTNPDAVQQVWEPTAEIFDPNSPWQENSTLKDFLGVLAWGMDYLRNYHDTILWANDAKRTHLANLYRLAGTLGEEWEPRVPARLMRQKVENAGVLAQRRGTLDGLREVVNVSVGYDVDLSIGPNMFLNEDQAGFANPQYDEWNPGINYAVNDMVKYESQIYKCIAGAYGNDQRPPDPGTTSNTWWEQVTSSAVTNLRNADTGAIVTWQAWRDGTNLQTDDTTMASGVSSAVDQTDNASNALWIQNTSTAAHTYVVMGAANTLGTHELLPEPEAAVRQGIPLPRLLTWDETVEYIEGDYVMHEGISYRARRANQGRSPRDYHTDWEQMGYDERLPLKFSFYAHAGYDGSASVSVAPQIEFFDGRGNHVGSTEDSTGLALPFYDTFNRDIYKAWEDRTPDVVPASGISWTESSGRWLAVPNGEGSCVAWPTEPGLALVDGSTNMIWPTYRLAVTFGKAPLDGTQALVFACDSTTPTSFVEVNRTGIVENSNGTAGASATFDVPILDGDRVTVRIDGTNSTASVFVNNESTPRGEITFTLTDTHIYGLMVE